MELKIERRWPDWGWCCIFHIGDQEYLGSLIIQDAYADYYGPECIIFKTENGQFSFDDALGECGSRTVEFSPDGLKECVMDFINSKL